jgi:polyribonucleotide nucleotidyltransferase
VNLLCLDDSGKVRLSMKQVDQQTGEDLSKKPQSAPTETQQAG